MNEFCLFVCLLFRNGELQKQEITPKAVILPKVKSLAIANADLWDCGSGWHIFIRHKLPACLARLVPFQTWKKACNCILVESHAKLLNTATQQSRWQNFTKSLNSLLKLAWQHRNPMLPVLVSVTYTHFCVRDTSLKITWKHSDPWGAWSHNRFLIRQVV